MNKKAQAAMEFLMTYGWAILVVLAAIGALAYFGVLIPSKFLPDKCMSSTGTACVGGAVADRSDNKVMFVLHNGLGYNVLLDNNALNVSLPTGCTPVNFGPKGDTTGASYALFNDSGDVTVIATCTGMTDSFKGDFTFMSTNPKSGLPEQLSVTVQVKVKD